MVVVSATDLGMYGFVAETAAGIFVETGPIPQKLCHPAGLSLAQLVVTGEL